MSEKCIRGALNRSMKLPSQVDTMTLSNSPDDSAASIKAGYSLIIFGFFGTFAGFAAFFLPETKGKNLPESIAEAESADDSYQFSDFSKLCFKRNSTL